MVSDSSDPRGWRTVLFVPADRPEMLARAQERGADAILIDLEDAIPHDGKVAARETLLNLLASGALAGPAAICVRVNGQGEGLEQDVVALAGSRLDAIVVPKAADPLALAAAGSAMARAWPEGLTGLIPQVESARGVLETEALLRVDRVTAIAFGGEDFCVDLGVARSSDGLELLFPRAAVALNAAAVGLPAIDTIYAHIDDDEGLSRESRTARQLGFSGKLLIHPRQIESVRDVFTPSADELEWARQVLAADEDGDSAGVRVVGGQMVDAPVLAQAERIVARGR